MFWLVCSLCSLVCKCPFHCLVRFFSCVPILPHSLESECLSFVCFLHPYSFLSASKPLGSKLSSYCDKVLLLFYRFIFVLLTHLQPPLLISSDDHIHHKLIGTFPSLLFASVISDIKIVIILILEHACLSYASQSLIRNEALDRAYSQCCASDILLDLTKQLGASSKEYSIIQFTEFILKHHLWYLLLIYIMIQVFFFSFTVQYSLLPN